MRIGALTILLVLVQPLFASAQEEDRKDTSAAELQEVLRTALVNNRKLADQIDQLSTELAAVRNEMKDVRNEIRGCLSERDKLLSKMVQLTDELHQAKGVASRLEKRNEQLAVELSKGRSYIRGGNPPPDEEEDDEPIDVEGVVTAVAGSDFVEISIGSDDGIREGIELHVFRKSLYVGRVTVLKTTPNRSVARIIKERQKADFAKGDRVSTKVDPELSRPAEAPAEPDPK